MKKMISCLAILTIMSAMVSCGRIENGGTYESVSPSKTTAQTATTNEAASKDEKTEVAVNEKSTTADEAEKPASDKKADTAEKSDETIVPVINEADRLFGGYVSTQSGDLNMRKEPNTTSDVICSIPNGTQISVYSCGKNGWYITSFNDKVGYISADYVKEIESYDPAAGAGAANSYGYYPVTEQPQTSIAVSDLTGTWHCGDDTITFSDCSWSSGKFDMKYADKAVQGNVYLEYSLTPDNLQELWYNLYDNSGSFVIGFRAESGIQLTDIYAGQSGDPHYTRPLSD